MTTLSEHLAPERRERGFTLIETMVVVLIVCILVAIAIPAFLSWRESRGPTVNEGRIVAHEYDDPDKWMQCIAIGKNACGSQIWHEDEAHWFVRLRDDSGHEDTREVSEDFYNANPDGTWVRIP